MAQEFADASPPSWDSILDDLPFLIAHDDELQHDLSDVCDLLLEDALSSSDVSPASTASSSPGPSTTPTDAPPPPLAAPQRRHQIVSHAPKEPFHVRQKREMVMLQHQVYKLKAELARKQLDANEAPPPTRWQAIACTERRDMVKALRENEDLKAAVNEQSTLIEYMSAICRKRPRLHENIQSEEWQWYRLAAQTSLRVAAIHAIADRQLSRMQNTFIRAGVFAPTSAPLEPRVIRRSDGSSLLVLVHRLRLAAPVDVVGAAAWKVYNGEESPEWPANMTEDVARIDPNTVYIQVTHHDDQGRAHLANIIRKRYIDGRRQVVVSRSVLEDALAPHMTRGAIEDKWGWLEIVPDGESNCIATSLLQINMGKAMAIDEESLIADMMERASMSPGERASPPRAAPVVDPSVRSFIERARPFAVAMERKLTQAVEVYHRSLGIAGAAGAASPLGR